MDRKRRSSWRATHWLAAFVLATGGAEAQAPSEETIQYFKQNCASCHTIGGGRLAGPDLKGALQRRDRDWLVRFVLDPKALIDSGDSYAQGLLKEARGVVMPSVPGLTRDRAGKLIDLVDAESKLERSQFAGALVSDRPLTPADAALGAELFRGTRRFAAGGPACISCHSNAAIGGLGGGLLGPDLTDAYSRLEGRKALSAWLSAPPSPTMAPIYRSKPLDPDEVLALVAWLQVVAERGDEARSPPMLGFTLAGIGGAALILVLFDFLWRRRFRDVRKSLVERST
ncbi:MAG: cytochrome c [Planctomycetes bacterium]|nr:cytochrome c [Planctomycetota bacterium]